MQGSINNSDRPTRAEISLPALIQNLALVRELSGKVKIMAVVKAEAYGHGLIEIASELSKQNVDYLAVSFLEEGIQLRNAGIRTPILVMGGLVDEQIEAYLDNRIGITVSSVWKGKQADLVAGKCKKKAEVHLKVDTGMGRIGQNWQNLEVFFQEIKQLQNLNIIGLYSHLSSSDNPESNSTQMQIGRFRDAIKMAGKYDIHPPLTHIANSGAILQNSSQSDSTMVRPGIILYGYAPSGLLEGKFQFKPVMSLKTRVVYVKKPPRGTSIGYGSTWISPGNRWIATLPLGYGDGYPWQLGNKGLVIHRNRECPVIGRISMDQITIEAADEAYLGDEVLLFGSDGTNHLSLWRLSDLANTIPYEFLCRLKSRVPKVYLTDDK